MDTRRIFSGFRSVWIRSKSCRTEANHQQISSKDFRGVLTCNACEQLACETLYLTAGKWHKAIRFEEVEYTLAQEICDNADMVPEIEAVS